MKLRKGDSVQIVSGNDKGKVGRIIKVYPTRERLVVEGVNMVKKHARPTQDNPQGGILEKEAAIHISNVMLMAGGKPTKVGFKTLEDGKKVRVARITGEVID
jgi:large subunit ribosomal protein L24